VPIRARSCHCEAAKASRPLSSRRAQTLFEERALLTHLQMLTSDLDRRIRSRKAKHQW
jgi:hypothetical protein